MLTDAIAGISGGTTIKSFYTKTNTGFSQVPIGFAPLEDDRNLGFVICNTKSSNYYIGVLSFGGNYVTSLTTTSYSVCVFYIE